MPPISITQVYQKNLKAKKKIVVNIGGARSSKSHSIAQLLINKLITEDNIDIGIGRKTFPALRMTAYRLFINLLREHEIYNVKNHNRTENWYEHKGSRVQFFSLDNPEKIKSTEFNYIWLEEANEFTYDDYLILLTRLSGQSSGVQNKIFLSLNPVDVNGWVPKKLIPQKDVEVIKSTYKDNPFLPKEYKDVLEKLREQDSNYYRIYTLGEWGELKGLIYSNYEFIDSMPDNLDETIYGLDFGFNNPSALIEVSSKDNEIYIRERLYESELTNSQLITRLKDLGIGRKSPIYADCAEPARIEEIYNAGFNCLPAEKSVKDGIDNVKRRKLNILKDSINIQKEIQSYKWKSDKLNNNLDEPVKYNDHAMDALRYAMYTHFKNPSIRMTADSIRIGGKRATSDLA